MQDKEFNTGEPLGYFITWTAYGTWLPGDKRGWQKKGECERQLPNDLFREMAVAAMKETAFHLKPKGREIVEPDALSSESTRHEYSLACASGLY